MDGEACGRALGELLHVGAGEDDVGRLAAQLEQDLLQALGRLAHDLLADEVRARETDHVDVGMGREVLTGRDVPSDDVEHAGRQVGSVGDLAEDERLHRRVGRRLEHDAVSRSESRDHLRQVQVQREVERRDGGHHADRLLEDHTLTEPARADLRWQRVLEREAGRALCEPLGIPEAGVELESFGDPPGGARLGDDQVDQLGPATCDRLHESQQGVGALPRRHAAPGAVLEGLARRADGAVHVGDRALRHGADGLLGRRIDDVEPVIGRAVDPLAADIELVVLQRRRHVVSEIRPSALVIQR